MAAMAAHKQTRSHHPPQRETRSLKDALQAEHEAALGRQRAAHGAQAGELGAQLEGVKHKLQAEQQQHEKSCVCLERYVLEHCAAPGAA